MFRRDIEGLRAIAVALVVLHHAHVPGFAGGYIGVDVFFVVSGFLITGLLLRERESTGRISIPAFYARRARRILPAVTLVIIATVIASRFLLEPLRARGIGTDAIGGGGFFANIVFAFRSTDYFQTASPPSPLQHLWSLSVEEQFYVVWPVLLLLLMRGRPRPRTATITIAVLSAASFVVSVVQTSVSQPWAFFGLHARAWELGVGALLALGWSSVERVPQMVRSALGWIGIAAVAAAAVLISATTMFPGWVAAIPVLGTAAAIAAGTAHRAAPVAVLGRAPMQWIGARSYSIYLWHWPALIIAEGRSDGPLSPGGRAIAVGIAVVAAEISYRLIENPIRHARLFNARPRPALLLGAGLVASSVVGGVVLRTDSRVLATDSIAAAPTLAEPTIPPTASSVLTTSPSAVAVETDPTTPTSSSAPGSGSTSTDPPVADAVLQPESFPALLDALDTEVVPKNLEPSLGRASGNKPSIYREGCHASIAARRPRLCEYGVVDSDFTIALFGDSHAAQWFEALESIAISNGWRLLPFTKFGCPVHDELTYHPAAGGPYTACKAWQRNVLDVMEREQVRVVFMTNSYQVLDDTTRKSFPARTAARALDRVVNDVLRRSIQPVLITDTAYPGRDIPSCLSRSLRNVARCVTKKSEAIRQNQIDAVISTAKRNNVQYLDVRPWVCTDTACPVIIGNILMYRDSDHLTTTYVEFLTPLLEAAVAPYVNGVRTRLAARGA